MDQVTVQTPLKRKRSLDQITNPTRPVASGTMEFATGELLNADIDTSAPSVEKSTLDQNVRRRVGTSEEYMCPKFTRDLIWGPIGDAISASA
jgi:hypothetical protein